MVIKKKKKEHSFPVYFKYKNVVNFRHCERNVFSESSMCDRKRVEVASLWKDKLVPGGVGAHCQ